MPTLGGARGLGLAIAVACAELGARVAVLDVLEEPSETLLSLETQSKIKLHYHR
jgi:NAD(P)-dependent dehydrogenase (short-subunit alcohol dehydrogenase family)